MSTELDQLPDDKLSEVFAAEVAGFIKLDCCLWNVVDCRASFCRERSDGIWITNEPLFAMSLDAVFPFLNKAPFVTIGKTDTGWYVSTNDGEHYAESSTPSRASCICLIEYERAKKGVNESI